MADLTAAQFVQRQVDSATMLGRFGGPEFWFSQNVAVGAAQGLVGVNNPGPPNLTRPIEAFMVLIQFRLAISVAPYASVSPEAPQNFLQLVQFQGNHKDFGNITPIRLSGATCYAWDRITQVEPGSEYLIGVNKAAPPNRPFTTAFTGAVGTHDITIAYQIPVVPLMGVGGALKRQSTNFLWQPNDWGNTIQMQMQLGDASSFGDPTGSTVAIQGPGGVGNPLVTVFENYSLLGDYQTKMTRSGVVVRSEQLIPVQQAAAANNQLLLQLAHQRTTSVVLKTGRKQTTGLTGGVTTFASLTDVQMEATQLQVDNKPLRNNTSNLMTKSYLERQFATVLPEGYFLLTFVDGQGVLLAYPGDTLPGGSQFNLTSNVLTANAAQIQAAVQEYVLGGPFPG